MLRALTPAGRPPVLHSAELGRGVAGLDHVELHLRQVGLSCSESASRPRVQEVVPLSQDCQGHDSARLVAQTGCAESREFGQAVRRWRDRAAPEVARVPAGGRRRAAGLRREELAGLAGISADYPAEDHRPPRRRTHHTRLRHPHRRRRRPTDHGLHLRTRHRGRRTARTRRRPRHTGARRPGSEEVDRSMRKFAGKIGEKTRRGAGQRRAVGQAF